MLYVPLSMLGAASLAAWMSSSPDSAARGDVVAKDALSHGTSLGQFLNDPALLRRLSSSSYSSVSSAREGSSSAQRRSVNASEEMFTL